MKKQKIGFKNNKAINSKETKEQIEKLKQYKLNIYDSEGNKISWNDLYNPKKKRTILQAIIEDRRKRIDKNTLMADRPNIAIATIQNNKIVRFEYYRGKRLIYDLRSKKLSGKDLKPSLKSLPQLQL